MKLIYIERTYQIIARKHTPKRWYIVLQFQAFSIRGPFHWLSALCICLSLSISLCLLLCVHVPLLWIFVKLRLPISSSSNSISYSRAFGFAFCPILFFHQNEILVQVFLVWYEFRLLPSISEYPHTKIYSCKKGKERIAS